MIPLSSTTNRLLQQLSPEERARLEPHCEAHQLSFKQTVIERHRPVERVHFVETGVVSLVTELTDGAPIETGIIGNEGVVGLSAILGVSRSPMQGMCQIAGRSVSLPAQVLDLERKQCSAFFGVLLRYASFVTAMLAQLAACNRSHHVDARMSRWLLMTRDRVDGDEFPLTQEFLGQMLGVARPTINVVGATLQHAGFIRYSRGRISVVDRVGLESACCECYGRIRQEYELALGIPLHER